MLSTVTSKGRVTLPLALRERLGLVPGTRLDFGIDAAGNLVARALNNDPTAICGLLKRSNQPAVGVKEMDLAIADGASGCDLQ